MLDGIQRDKLAQDNSQYAPVQIPPSAPKKIPVSVSDTGIFALFRACLKNKTCTNAISYVNYKHEISTWTDRPGMG